MKPVILSLCTHRVADVPGPRGNRGGVSRQTGYRLEVTGLPKSASWQDLKDTCRRYGDVTFTQVRRVPFHSPMASAAAPACHAEAISRIQTSTTTRVATFCRAGDAGQ